MKLIIENVDGVLYAYMETEKHFKKVDKQRGIRVDKSLLSKDCNLDCLDSGEYIVFDIKK